MQAYHFKIIIMKSLESKTADCILEISQDCIIIAGEKYDIAPPTPATLILISKYISELPEVDGNTKNIVNEVLGKAKDLSIIGKIAATLILGAKRVKERRYVAVRLKPWRIKRMPELDYLADKILDEVSNADLFRLISDRLNNLQIGDFFVLTTSLSAANLLRRTKEVETASGE